MTTPTTSELERRFRAGDRGALARLLSLIENEHPAGTELLRQLTPHTQSAQVIGITGPPGAGKSSLISMLISAYRAVDKTVGVIAVDPSSRLTGGATLGDRVRMLDTWDDSAVYIRSMASRGHRGGLSRAVSGSIDALDAFGFDVVIVETVGTGQDEIDVASIADTVVLLQVPGLGDSVQSIKAGILEVAHIYVVNKSDLPGAEELFNDLQSMIRMSAAADWVPPVVKVSSSERSTVEALVEQINLHERFLQRTAPSKSSRNYRVCSEAVQLAMSEIEARLTEFCLDPALAETVELTATGELSTRDLAASLVNKLAQVND